MKDIFYTYYTYMRKFIFLSMILMPLLSKSQYFIANPSSGCAPLNVNFTNLINNTPPIPNVTTGCQFFWNFGNGQTSTSHTPSTVTYSTSGTYTVSYSAKVDTIGFILSEIVVTGVGCSDPLGDKPDIYVEIYDGNNTKVWTCESEAESGGPHADKDPPRTYNPNIILRKPPYRIKVIDNDNTWPSVTDDDCIDGSDGNIGSVLLVLPSVYLSGDTIIYQTEQNLVFSVKYSKLVFQVNQTENIIVEGPPIINIPYHIYCYGEPKPSLIASGSNIQWYSDSLLTNLIHQGDTLYIDSITQQGTYTFYATQSGTPCHNVASATFIIAPQGPSVNTVYAVYPPNTNIPPLIATGNNVKWYKDIYLTQLICNCDTIYLDTLNTPGIYNFYAIQQDPNNQQTSCPTIVTIKIQNQSECFSFTPQEGCGQLQVNFINNIPSNGYQPVLWQTLGFLYKWNFGNGQTSTLENPPTISYSSPGTYTVTYEAIIDTIGYYLKSIHISAIGCDDPDIWPTTNDPDIYIQIYDGNNVKIIDTYDDAYNYTVNPNNPNVTFNLNLKMSNPPYFLKVKDRDSGDSDDNCIDGNEHEGTTAILYPPYNSNSFGITVLNYTNNNLNFSCTYQKDVIIHRDTAIVTVHSIPSPPTLNFYDTTFCSGNNLPNLIAIGNNIKWYSSSSLDSVISHGNILSLPVLNNGSYTFYATQTSSSGCQSQPARTTFTIVPLTEPIIINSTPEICLGQNLILTTQGIGIEWYSDSNLTNLLGIGDTLSIILTQEGIYSIYAIQHDTLRGCKSNKSQTTVSVNKLTQPVLNIQNYLLCEGEQIPEITVIYGDNVLWYSDSNLTQFITAGDTLHINEIPPDTLFSYYAINVDSVKNCSSDPTKVTFYLKKINVNLTTQNTLCSYSSDGSATAIINAEMPVKILWSNGDTSLTVNNLEKGEHTITVTDKNHCVKIVSFNIDSPEEISCIADITGTICKNSRGIISLEPNGGTPPYNYAWQTGDTTQSINNIQYGTYTVTITDNNNCIYTFNFFVPNEEHSLYIDGIVRGTRCNNNEGMIKVEVQGGTAPYNYLWSNGSISSIAEGLIAGNYTLTVTDYNGCQAQAIYTITDGCLEIPSAITPNADGINDVWRIGFIELYPEAEVEIYNRWGNKVFYSKPYTEPWDGTQNGKELPIGSYYYIIKLNYPNTLPITGIVDIIR